MIQRRDLDLGALALPSTEVERHFCLLQPTASVLRHLLLQHCFRILSVMLISISTFITRRHKGLLKKNNSVVSINNMTRIGTPSLLPLG